MRTFASISIARCGACAAVTLPWRHQHVGDLLADRADRVERGARILEYRSRVRGRGFRPVSALGVRAGRARRTRCVPAVTRAARVEDAHDRVGGDRLARAALADQRQRLAAPQLEADAVERAHGAAAGAELDAEILDGSRDGAVIAVMASSCPPPRVDDVAQPVAHQVEAEHRRHQHQRRGTARPTIRRRR